MNKTRGQIVSKWNLAVFLAKLKIKSAVEIVKAKSFYPRRGRGPPQR